MSAKIGFIGLGVMGGPMAANIGKQFEITVHDLDPARREIFPAAQQAGSIAEVGRAAGVILLSLPTTSIVREVVLGQDGLLSVLASGQTVIDTSTTEPQVSQAIAAELGARGIGFLDAPVSGGEKAAKEATLSIMVGGKEAVFEACLPILQAMGTTVVRMGEAGAGEITKLVNNLIVGINFAAVAEGFALGVRCGLDPELLYQAIRSGWAGSRVLEVAVPAMLARDFRPGGSVNIHWKDLGYALSLAKEEDVPVPVTALVHEIFKAARASGRGALAQPAIVNLWEDLIGVEVKKS